MKVDEKASWSAQATPFLGLTGSGITRIKVTEAGKTKLSGGGAHVGGTIPLERWGLIFPGERERSSYLPQIENQV